MSIIENSILAGLWDPKKNQYEMKSNMWGIVNKIWGKEYIIPTEEHTVKYMFIYPKSECSLHFHKNKSEVFTLIQGELEIILFNKDGDKQEVILKNILDSVILPPCTPHLFRNLSNSSAILIESSSLDDPSDSYRLSRSKTEYEKPVDNR